MNKTTTPGGRAAARVRLLSLQEQPPIPRRLCLLMGAFHPVVGGGETQMQLLTSALHRRGIHCQVITQRRPANVPKFSHVDGVPVHRVWPRDRNRSGKYLMMLPASWQLARLRSHYDVILVSGIRTLGVVGVITGTLLRKSVVLRMASREEMSGGYIGQGKRDWSQRLARPMVRWRNRILRRADRFVSVSSAVRTEYLECGVEEARIIDIPNGTDIGRFHPLEPAGRSALRERLGLPVGHHLYVYTGKLNRGKGLPMLLRVWRRLAGEHLHLGLVLVGGGANQALSCEPQLREFVRAHQLEDSVTFAGYRDDVVPYLQAADAFVLPSDSEAMPNSLIEAMACGLPCIATAVGGVLDIIEDGRNGILTAPGDEDRLHQVMSALLGDDERAQRLGAQARIDAIEKYDREINVERFVRMLDALPDPRDRPTAGPHSDRGLGENRELRRGR